MLTPEERQRIEEEEGKRIAEEQYRAEVRAKLQGAPAAPARKPSRVPWILGVGAVLIIGALVLTNSRSQSKTGDDSGITAQAASNPAPVQKTRYVPVNQKIATGQIVVRANGYVQYRITITPEMVGPTVTGSFKRFGWQRKRHRGGHRRRGELHQLDQRPSGPGFLDHAGKANHRQHRSEASARHVLSGVQQQILRLHGQTGVP